MSKDPVPHQVDGRRRRAGFAPSLGRNDPRLRQQVRQGVSEDAQREGVGRDAHGRQKVRLDPKSPLHFTPAGEVTVSVSETAAAVQTFNTSVIQGSGRGGGPPASGAPDNAQYLVGAPDATLTSELVVTDTSSISWDVTTPGQAKAALVSTIVAGGPTGDSTHTPRITWNAAGQLTAVSSVAISGGGGSGDSTLAWLGL